MAKILVIHGPNLNLLGNRETDIYGETDLAKINENLINEGKSLELEVTAFQSNEEGALVDKIHDAQKNVDGLIINPAAFSHYSIAIRDAISAISIPVIEVHLSNIYAREEFRHKSVISAVVKGVIGGFGPNSYVLALRAIKDLV